MRKLFNSYTSFSRLEKKGLFILILILLVLLIVRIYMSFISRPTHLNEVEVIKVINDNKPTQPKAGEKINLNVADSLTLISINGIGKGLSHRILERRRTLGKFQNMQQVFDVYKFSEKTKKTLLEQTYIE